MARNRRVRLARHQDQRCHRAAGSRLSALAGLGAALLPQGAIAVLAVPPGSALPALLGAAIGAPLVFAHTPYSPALARPAGVHVALAAHDHDIATRTETIWPGAGAPLLRRRRRIDTLYADRTIGLILLAGGGDAAAVLAGATAVLSRDRPAVLAAGGVALAPDPAELSSHVRHSLADGITCWLPHPGAPPALPPPAPPASLSVPFDLALISAGFHPPEHDNPGGGRWSGASVSAWFLMPRPAPGAYRLRLDMADWGVAATGLALRLDRSHYLPTLRGAMTADFAPIAVAPSDEPLRLRLLTPPAERDMRRGPRRIGIRVLRATLHPLG